MFVDTLICCLFEEEEAEEKTSSAILIIFPIGFDSPGLKVSFFFKCLWCAQLVVIGVTNERVRVRKCTHLYIHHISNVFMIFNQRHFDNGKEHP